MKISWWQQRSQATEISFTTLTIKTFALYTQYFHWQLFPPLQTNAFLSKPHILNVFRSGHKSWMFVTEAVSGMMGFYPLQDPTQWSFVTCLWFWTLRCFMLRCHGLQAWRQWPLPTGRWSHRTLRHVPSLNKQCLGWEKGACTARSDDDNDGEENEKRSCTWRSHPA